MIRASQPVETKTVYVMPKPNPKRAEILARVLKPTKHPYTPLESSETPVLERFRMDDQGLESVVNSKFVDEIAIEACCEETAICAIEEVLPENTSQYPEVPADYPFDVIWNRESLPAQMSQSHLNNIILIDKVLIKLWKQGDHSFIAAEITPSGKVYPHYSNTIYVRWKEKVDKNGLKWRYIGFASSGGDVRLTSEQMRKGEIPPGIRVLDYNSNGYDAYEFLSE